jgi:hypothetical protein
MTRFTWLVGLSAALLSVFAFATPGQGAFFNGTVYYTRFTGGQNVGSVDYLYDDVTKTLTLSNNHNIAAVNGADGILFAPNGNLLIGGQNSGLVHERTTSGAFVKNVFPGTQGSFHLALSPDGKTLYTSPFGGPLDTIPLVNGGLSGNGTAHAVTGNDTGVTQIVFDGSGNSYYVTGQPNGFGNFGRINLNTFQTTRLLFNRESIHGTHYDPFTGLITFFGAGKVGTYDPTTGVFKQSANDINVDFDQGALDGFGHAFIAGNNQLTFIDYSATGDITSAANVVRIFNGANGLSFAGIDDVAPLAGPGSNPNSVPAPPAALLLTIGGLTVLCGHRRWRKEAAPSERPVSSA